MKRLKKSRYKIILFTVIFFTLSPIFSSFAQENDSTQNSFSISLNYRPRLEVRDGAFRPLADDEKVAALVSDRIRLNFDYTYNNFLIIRVSPQVVSIWGQSNMVQGVENVGNKLSLFESWAKLQISPSWYAQIGRQVISLDDERFFGGLDWAQGGRAHDALSLHFSKNNFEVKGFFAYNQNYKMMYGNNISNTSGNLYSTVDAFPHKWMQTIWAKFPLGENSKITVLATNLGFQQAAPSDDSAPEYFSQTYGANYFFKNENVNAQIAGYFQTGKNIFGTTTEAYTATVNVNYNLNKKWSIGIGSDLISGNDVKTFQTVNHSFNPYFQTGHKFYGFMDYFYAGNSHKNAGISDSYLKLKFNTTKKLSLAMAVHQFITPNNVRDSNKEYKSDLGQEMDLTFSFKINPFINLVGGYSFYLATPTTYFLKNVPQSDTYQQWAWLSLNITPTLFKTKN